MSTLADQYKVFTTTLEGLQPLWQRTRSRLSWDNLFVTPAWLETVVGQLGADGEPRIFVVTRNGEEVGIVPLCCSGKSATFLGTADVCDYQDAVLAPGQEEVVTRHLLAHLSAMGIHQLDLQTLRPDAAFLRPLEDLEKTGEIHITKHPVDTTYETPLPGTWDDYLMQLNGKQRHEVRRKIRRLEAHGDFCFRPATPGQDIDEAADAFLRLFHMNREDKSRFMDDTMSAYFRSLIARLAQQEMLRLFFLDVGGRPAATVLCFDYNGTRYLYNSGYDANHRDLSVGILSKVLSIREAIAAGCRKYDFLKGAEVYKKRIGGHALPLYRFVVTLQPAD